MKINDRFTIRRDKYNYILVETNEYVNPTTGEITHPEIRSYYPDLISACKGLIKRDVDTENMQTIIDSHERLVAEISAAILLAGM